jgi:hypothetical protein
MNRLVEKGAMLSAQHIPLGMCPKIFRSHSYGMAGFGGGDAFLPSVPSLTGWRLRIESNFVATKAHYVKPNKYFQLIPRRGNNINRKNFARFRLSLQQSHSILINVQRKIKTARKFFRAVLLVGR